MSVHVSIYVAIQKCNSNEIQVKRKGEKCEGVRNKQQNLGEGKKIGK